MIAYRELYFRGNREELASFVREIKAYATDNWVLAKQTGRWKDYLVFDYIGTEAEHARLLIFAGDRLDSGEIKVGNIAPLEKNHLTIEEYNTILLSFYNEVIVPYEKNGPSAEIFGPTSDKFDPLTVISEEALAKLKRFCSGVDKSSGISNTRDQERYFDFICQTINDGKTLNSTIFANFLQDKEYWGEKPADFIGNVGDFAWDERPATMLAGEYDYACKLIRYYKKTQKPVEED